MLCNIDEFNDLLNSLKSSQEELHSKEFILNKIIKEYMAIFNYVLDQITANLEKAVPFIYKAAWRELLIITMYPNTPDLQQHITKHLFSSIQEKTMVDDDILIKIIVTENEKIMRIERHESWWVAPNQEWVIFIPEQCFLELHNSICSGSKYTGITVEYAIQQLSAYIETNYSMIETMIETNLKAIEKDLQETKQFHIDELKLIEQNEKQLEESKKNAVSVLMNGRQFWWEGKEFENQNTPGHESN